MLPTSFGVVDPSVQRLGHKAIFWTQPQTISTYSFNNLKDPKFSLKKRSLGFYLNSAIETEAFLQVFIGANSCLKFTRKFSKF